MTTTARRFAFSASSDRGAIPSSSLRCPSPDPPDGDPVPETYVDTGPGGLGLSPGVVVHLPRAMREPGGLLGLLVVLGANADQRPGPTPGRAGQRAGDTAPGSLPPARKPSISTAAPRPAAKTPRRLRPAWRARPSSTPRSATARQYYYQVSAVDTGGESAPSAESSALPLTPIALAPPPTGIAATPGDRTVLLAWRAAAGASTYNVYRGTASGAEVLLAKRRLRSQLQRPRPDRRRDLLL